ncbi:MAG: GNAT family N-acetyltransferase [Desulfitobacterium sp.]|nr:GNAT family N-acetyltransferase [Desulfitobacterium sp.]
MNIRYQFDCTNIDWNEIPQIFIKSDMKHYQPTVHKTAFENSYSVVFAFDQDKLIGFGRAICDGAYEAALYDVVILPEYQGRGIGSTIVKHILNSLPTCNVILFSSIGKEGFYKKLGFEKMNTGMAKFANPQRMRQRGYIN